jgi:S1-C subfamily serine protease
MGDNGSTMMFCVKQIWMVFFLAIVFAAVQESPAADETVKASVVKIYSIYADYNYSQPWQKKSQGETSGSGCIIEGKRILTNAHVVGNSAFLQVKRSDQSKKYNARVDIVAHECDLAVLRVEDESFFEGIHPVALSELPGIRDRVAVYGFPVGGDELSITEGVVSRIEHVRYAHSSAYLMACQIDAAINSGNSGGPVIRDGRIVGVAFQTSVRGENIGYMIATPVIRHFLEDIRDGRYDGIPDLGLTFQNLENPDLRKFYRMSSRHTGVLIARVNDFSPARGVLHEGDVLLSLNAFPIGNDGTVEFRKGERTSLLYAVQNQYIHDKIPVVILRNGLVKKTTIRLTQTMQSMRLVPGEQYDVPPEYYIAGGMVFEPLTKNYLLEWGDKWYDEGPTLLLNYYFNGRKTQARREIVVLVRVLADEINVGYHNYANKVVSKVNRRSICDMRDVIAAIENHQGKYHVIETEDGLTIVLQQQHGRQYLPRILERYQIPSDRSPGLSR